MKRSDPIFGDEEMRFSRMGVDQLKENDLRVLFETLMTQPQYRTMGDVNTLMRIMCNVCYVGNVVGACEEIEECVGGLSFMQEYVCGQI